MKSNILLFRAAIIIIIMNLILVSCMLLVSFSDTGVKSITEGEMTPHLDIEFDQPTSKNEQMRSKFEIYLFPEYEGGKEVIEIYSKKQVEDINKAKQNGRIYSLTTQEVIFLIHDTVKLFYGNDIVRITDKDGVLHEFFGVNYYSSEEYFANFGGFDIGRTDISYDLKEDIYFTIKTRLEMICSSMYSDGNATYLITNVSKKLTSNVKEILSTRIEVFNHMYEYGDEWFDLSGLEKLAGSNLDAFRFFDGRITYSRSITNAEYTTVVEAYPSGSAPFEAGEHKYDRNGKVVVIEVYRRWSTELIARIRLDNKSNEEEIARLCRILERTRPYYEERLGNFSDVYSNYRFAVYFNGINFRYGDATNVAIIFDPDGDIGNFAFTNGYDIFNTRYVYMSGAEELTTYIRELVKNRLQ